MDGKGKALFPGFVNTHTHLFQVLLKGLTTDMVLTDWARALTIPSSTKVDFEGDPRGGSSWLRRSDKVRDDHHHRLQLSASGPEII